MTGRHQQKVENRSNLGINVIAISWFRTL